MKYPKEDKNAQVKKLEYEYEVEEYSNDTRTFTVESNKKLPQDVTESVYWQECELEGKDVGIEHDITEYVYESLESLGYDKDHEDFKKLKVITKFTGTGFGDDTQIDSSGDFFELEKA